MYKNTFNGFEYSFITNNKNISGDCKMNIINNIIKKHCYEKITYRLLAACFDYIDDIYKIYVPTNDDYGVVKVNDMGIKFTIDFNEEYIKELNNLFLEDNYEFKYYDMYYLKNLCNMDIKDIKLKYPNIRISTIRSILMYIDKDKLDETFAYLNDKSDEFQINYCNLITPVIIDVTTEKGTNNFDTFTGCFLRGDKFYPYNKYDNLDVYEYAWMVDSENDYFDKGYYKTINTKFIEYFNTYFFELINKYNDKLDDKTINILYKIKECSLNHIPEVKGSIHREDIYETVSYEAGDYDREAACCPGSYTVYEEKIVGSMNVSTLDFNEDKFQIIKKLIENIFNMLLNGNIEYKQLMEYDENDLILDIINSIEKGKVLSYEN